MSTARDWSPWGYPRQEQSGLVVPVEKEHTTTELKIFNKQILKIFNKYLDFIYFNKFEKIFHISNFNRYSNLRNI